MPLNSSDAASRWAGSALVHPEFWVSGNPIPTKGADYAHSITACPLGFENLTASLNTPLLFLSLLSILLEDQIIL